MEAVPPSRSSRLVLPARRLFSHPEDDRIFVDIASLSATGWWPGDAVQIATPSGKIAAARLAIVEPSGESDAREARIGARLMHALKLRLGSHLTLTRMDPAPLLRVVVRAQGIESGQLTEREVTLHQQWCEERRLLFAHALVAPRWEGAGHTQLEVASTEPPIGVVTEHTQVLINLAGASDMVALTGPSGAVDLDDVGGIDQHRTQVRELIEYPLLYPDLYRRLSIRPTRGIILHGPPGVGKTYLARAIASDLGVHYLQVNGPQLVSSTYGETEANLRQLFEQARAHAPAIIVIDELDAIAPPRGSSGSQADTRMVTQLLALMDGLMRIENVVVIGTTNRLDAIDAALRRPGRFDRELFISPPDAAGRREILDVHTRSMPLTAACDRYLDEVARVTHGFVGADLMDLCREAGLNALRRAVQATADTNDPGAEPDPVVDEPDFARALGHLRPSALRESVLAVSEVDWTDVAGTDTSKERLREIVLGPVSHPETFQAMRIAPPRGVLLHGQPGTGKTLLVKALVKVSGMNFIPVAGAELFSKWLGDSEANVRHIFRLARQVAPTIVFFDQFDAMAGTRGEDVSTRAAERVVNQLVAEMDNLESVSQVIVLAATNRLDLIDPALLRPGRFGTLVEVGLPSEPDRAAIAELHLRDVPMASGASLRAIVALIASATHGASGADVVAACTETKMQALRTTRFSAPVPLAVEHASAALQGLGYAPTP